MVLAIIHYRHMVTLVLVFLNIPGIDFPQSIQISVQYVSLRIRHKNMPAPFNAWTQISFPLQQVIEYSLRFLSFRSVLVSSMVCLRNLCALIVRDSG